MSGLKNHILNRLETLRDQFMQLEPDQATRETWEKAVFGYTDQFLGDLEEAPVYTITEDKGAALLDHPIGMDPMDPAAVMQLFAQAVDRPGLNPASGGHLGYIPGGGLYPGALGDYLAAATNRYSGVFFGSPGAVRMENQLVRWMADLAGYGPEAAGNLMSGGSLANLVAVVAARDAKGITPDKVNSACIYLSEQVHHCVHKAIHYSGLSQAQLRWVPLDDHYRMDIERLTQMIEEDKAAGKLPFMVIASAGTTDTGAMDPLKAIGNLAKQHNLWYHVDAAYGGFFMLVDELRPLFYGIEMSDSYAIDPHKGLFLSYGLGAVVVRDGAGLRASNTYEANYMQDTFAENEEASPADLGPELSKHFRGLRLWLPLKLLGLGPFKAALEEKVLLCRYFHEAVGQLPGFETGPTPELSVAIFRYIPKVGEADAFNERLVQAVKADGRVFLSSTNINGTYWIRIAILAFRTHLKRIDTCLAVLKEKVAELEAEA